MCRFPGTRLGSLGNYSLQVLSSLCRCLHSREVHTDGMESSVKTLSPHGESPSTHPPHPTKCGVDLFPIPYPTISRVGKGWSELDNAHKSMFVAIPKPPTQTSPWNADFPLLVCGFLCTGSRQPLLYNYLCLHETFLGASEVEN